MLSAGAETLLVIPLLLSARFSACTRLQKGRSPVVVCACCAEPYVLEEPTHPPSVCTPPPLFCVDRDFCFSSFLRLLCRPYARLSLCACCVSSPQLYRLPLSPLLFPSPHLLAHSLLCFCLFFSLPPFRIIWRAAAHVSMSAG